MHSGHNAPAGAHDSPYDAFEDDELSIESEQWARDDAAVRAELLRGRQAEIEDRRQFGTPVYPTLLARIMGAWVADSLERGESETLRQF
ncbi:hypothetical protein [Caballeronia sp. SBC2]|uniref:hypothetical protein n=1 Tax=Caballeronia sp. SBC2 TaxID=2705547 RepID=UPI0013E131F3|nr:hypothetical protein [Caballeronia sp. SBC2]QIE29663.1 hypothetical protein SBC2_77390 [Caballeronia sp. SBC2]